MKITTWNEQAAREKYQGQGYMRKVLDIAFAEGNRLQVPVILETDAKSKCDKYMHLGMKLDGVRNLGDYGKLYEFVKKGPLSLQLNQQYNSLGNLI